MANVVTATMKTELAVLVACAVIIGLQGFLGGKEAYEYVNPYLLFWLKFAFAGLGAGALVAKAFMSRTYGDDKDAKEEAAKQEAKRETDK